MLPIKCGKRKKPSIEIGGKRGKKTSKNKEIPFCELPEMLLMKMLLCGTTTKQIIQSFSVCGIDIRVLDDELAEALKNFQKERENSVDVLLLGNDRK